MLLTVTLNPCVDHLLLVDTLKVGDTNRVKRQEKDAGGKGLNTSRVFAKMGGVTIATGFLGGATSAFIRHVMKDENVLDGFVYVAGETRTNFSVEDESGNPPTTFNQKGPEISPGEWLALKEKIGMLSVKADWVSFGGSLPPGVETNAFYELALIAREKGSKICIDADGPVLTEAIKAMPDMIKPNSREASRLLGRSVETDEEALVAVKDLYTMIGGGDRYAIISRGGKGAVMTCSEGTFVGVSPNIEPRSTIGSGDSMIAGILRALGQGRTVDQAFRWGLAAGAATALTDGSAIGDRETIERLYPEATAVPV
jgi:1-phosphofructokinase family hexose kinase